MFRFMISTAPWILDSPDCLQEKSFMKNLVSYTKSFSISCRFAGPSQCGYVAGIENEWSVGMGRRDKRWKCGLALRMMLFGVTAGATDLLRGPRRIRCQSRHSRAALCHPAAGSWIHFKGLEVTGVQVTITADDFASLDESLLPPHPRRPPGPGQRCHRPGHPPRVFVPGPCPRPRRPRIWRLRPARGGIGRPHARRLIPAPRESSLPRYLRFFASFVHHDPRKIQPNRHILELLTDIFHLFHGVSKPKPWASQSV